MALLQTLTDNFDDNSLNTSLWDSTGAQISETNGQLEITTTLASQYDTLSSKTTYDLTGSYAQIKVVDASGGSLNTYDATPISLVKDGSNSIAWVIYGGQIRAYANVGGGGNTQLAAVAYTTSSPIWLKIRETGGTVYWDYSLTGLDGSWTNLHNATVASLFAVTALTMNIVVGHWDVEVDTFTAKFDDFNVLLSGVPTVSTASASSVTINSAVLNGNLTNENYLDVTERGFQYNTVASEAYSTFTTGSFATGAYTASLTGLTAGQTYYFRAYAKNADGYGYGEWFSFTCTDSTYSITIDGIDRTTDVMAGTLYIEDVINDQQNLCTFNLIDRSENGLPSNEDEVIVTLDNGTKLFGGLVTNVNLPTKREFGEVYAVVQCVDYSRLLDRKLVRKTYENMTDAAIIADIVNTYATGSGITTTNVIEGVTIDQITFNYLQPSQCFRKICELTGRSWYIDYDKDIHYFPLETNEAPIDIDSSSANYWDLAISKNATQIKNRVFVRGGTYLSDFTTYSEKGDGVKKKFVLPDKPHNVTVTVNGVSKTLGIKNLDTTGYDYYLNFQEKFIEQDSGASALASGDTLAVTYKYDIPILVVVEDPTSIATHGVHEFAIFDKAISTKQAARDRASAELTDYAENLIEGGFKTYVSGWKSGQFMTINLSDYGINETYLIQRVICRSEGGGNYLYEVSIASAQTMGIIKFLIELLEANKNLIELNDDEVLDELLSLTDSLLSDSLLDSLIIDSAGAYRTWASIPDTSVTRARWNLFEWK